VRDITLAPIVVTDANGMAFVTSCAARAIFLPSSLPIASKMTQRALLAVERLQHPQKARAVVGNGLMRTRRKRLPRPAYRVTFASTLVCTRCRKTATVTGEDKVLASLPENLPPGWVCDAGDKRAILSPVTGKPIELLHSGLVLAMFAPYCSARCARTAGAKGPLKRHPRRRNSTSEATTVT
jgi:hypothetical protein